MDSIFRPYDDGGLPIPFDVADPFVFHTLTSFDDRAPKELRERWFKQLLDDGAVLMAKRERRKADAQGARRSDGWPGGPTGSAGMIYEVDERAGDARRLFFSLGRPIGSIRTAPNFAFRLSTLRKHAAWIGLRPYDLLGELESADDTALRDRPCRFPGAACEAHRTSIVRKVADSGTLRGPNLPRVASLIVAFGEAVAEHRVDPSDPVFVELTTFVEERLRGAFEWPSRYGARHVLWAGLLERGVFQRGSAPEIIAHAPRGIPLLAADFVQVRPDQPWFAPPAPARAVAGLRDAPPIVEAVRYHAPRGLSGWRW